MTGVLPTMLLAAITVLDIGSDTRVGGRILRGEKCLYAVGGGNVGGQAQIRRVPVDESGVPTGRIVNCGIVYDGSCGATAAAIMGRWLFVTGGDRKGETVRYDIRPDGALENRTVFVDPEIPRVFAGSLVASGRCLVLLGGWQSRQVHVAEVTPEGAVGQWRRSRPLPTISFSEGRAFRAGDRIYVSGNPVYQGATDRVYSCDVDDDGRPRKWRRWAELPESAWCYDFELMPDGQNVFYANHETGHMYVARLLGAGEIGSEGEPAEAGEIGVWKRLSGELPADRFVSRCAIPLDVGYFRLSVLNEDPRKFLPPDLVRY